MWLQDTSGRAENSGALRWCVCACCGVCVCVRNQRQWLNVLKHRWSNRCSGSLSLVLPPSLPLSPSLSPSTLSPHLLCDPLTPEPSQLLSCLLSWRIFKATKPTVSPLSYTQRYTRVEHNYFLWYIRKKGVGGGVVGVGGVLQWKPLELLANVRNERQGASTCWNIRVHQSINLLFTHKPTVHTHIVRKWCCVM